MEKRQRDISYEVFLSRYYDCPTIDHCEDYWKNPKSVHYYGARGQDKNFGKEEIYLTIRMLNIPGTLRIFVRFFEVDLGKLNNWKKKKKLNVFQQFIKEHDIDVENIKKSNILL